MARKHVLLSTAFAAVTLAGCGGSQPAAHVQGSEIAQPREVRLIGQEDGATLLRSGERSQTLRGRFEHASAGPAFPRDGRSQNGSRIVLQDIANATNDRVSRFAIVDTTLAEPAHMVDLRGDFDYDAVSPTADTLYLVSHFSVERPDQYAVRSYDVASDTLDDAAVADKSTIVEGAMAGQAVARTSSAGGEWVYTAYRGEHSFIHALNTIEKFAVCVDMPERAAHVDQWQLELNEATTTLVATSASTGMTVRVDTDRFEATLARTAEGRSA